MNTFTYLFVQFLQRLLIRQHLQMFAYYVFIVAYSRTCLRRVGESSCTLPAVLSISGSITSKGIPCFSSICELNAYIWFAKLQAKTAARCKYLRCPEVTSYTLGLRRTATIRSNSTSAGADASIKRYSIEIHFTLLAKSLHRIKYPIAFYQSLP